eukprot:COSAG01_NODE_1317_length_10750_cov_1.790536_4_plen_59_part_00
MLHKLFADFKSGALDVPKSDDLPRKARGVAVLAVGCTGHCRQLMYHLRHIMIMIGTLD